MRIDIWCFCEIFRRDYARRLQPVDIDGAQRRQTPARGCRTLISNEAIHTALTGAWTWREKKTTRIRGDRPASVARWRGVGRCYVVHIHNLIFCIGHNGRKARHIAFRVVVASRRQLNYFCYFQYAHQGIVIFLFCLFRCAEKLGNIRVRSMQNFN